MIWFWSIIFITVLRVTLVIVHWWQKEKEQERRLDNQRKIEAEYWASKAMRSGSQLKKTDQELLDSIDFKVVERYVRKKKLEKFGFKKNK